MSSLKKQSKHGSLIFTNFPSDFFFFQKTQQQFIKSFMLPTLGIRLHRGT